MLQSLFSWHNGFCIVFFFFKQKTAYEMRISDWSSDVCSSDLHSLLQSMMIDRALRCRNRKMSNAAPELPDAVRHRGCSRNSRQRGPVRTVNIWSAEADSRQLHRNDQIAVAQGRFVDSSKIERHGIDAVGRLSRHIFRNKQ